VVERVKPFVQRKHGNIVALFQGLLRTQNWRFNPNFALFENRFTAIMGFSENVSEFSLQELLTEFSGQNVLVISHKIALEV